MILVVTSECHSYSSLCKVITINPTNCFIDRRNIYNLKRIRLVRNQCTLMSSPSTSVSQRVRLHPSPEVTL